MPVTLVANLQFPLICHVLSGDTFPASRADLVRVVPLKVKDIYSLERLSRMGERSRIEGAVATGRVEGQDATPEPRTQCTV